MDSNTKHHPHSARKKGCTSTSTSFAHDDEAANACKPVVPVPSEPSVPPVPPDCRRAATYQSLGVNGRDPLERERERERERGRESEREW